MPVGVFRRRARRAPRRGLSWLTAADAYLLVDLLSHWTEDETSGTRYDSRGNHDLDDVNTVGTAAGALGNASQHVAASSEYLKSTTLAIPAGSKSMQRWVYLDSTGVAHGIMGKWGGGSNAAFRLYVSSSDKVVGQIKNAGGTVTITGGTTLSAAGWYLATLVHDRTAQELRLYVNGVSDATPQAFTGDSYTGALDFWLGNASSMYLDGRGDEAAFWGRALTAAEASRLYGGGTPLAFSQYGVAPAADSDMAPVGTSVTTGHVTLSALGALTPVGAASTPATVSLSALGSLTPAGAATTTAAAALSALGSLAPRGGADTPARVSLSALASITPVGVAAVQGMVAFSSASDLEPVGVSIATGSVSLSALGHLSPVGKAIATGRATISAIASVEVSGVALTVGQASLSALGTITMSGAAEIIGTAALGALSAMSPRGVAATTGTTSLINRPASTPSGPEVEIGSRGGIRMRDVGGVRIGRIGGVRLRLRRM